jgi:hypothetical protein
LDDADEPAPEAEARATAEVKLLSAQVACFVAVGDHGLAEACTLLAEAILTVLRGNPAGAVRPVSQALALLASDADTNGHGGVDAMQYNGRVERRTSMENAMARTGSGGGLPRTSAMRLIMAIVRGGESEGRFRARNYGLWRQTLGHGLAWPKPTPRRNPVLEACKAELRLLQRYITAY